MPQRLSRTSTGGTRPQTVCSPRRPPRTTPSPSPSPSGASGQDETPLPAWTPSLWSGTMTMTSVVTWSLPCPELCPLRMRRVRKTKISTSGELLACQVGKRSASMPARKKRKGMVIRPETGGLSRSAFFLLVPGDIVRKGTIGWMFMPLSNAKFGVATDLSYLDVRSYCVSGALLSPRDAQFLFFSKSLQATSKECLTLRWPCARGGPEA